MDAETIYRRLRRQGLLLYSEKNLEGKMRIATLEDVHWLTILTRLRGIESIIDGFEAGVFTNRYGRVLGIYAAFHFFNEEDDHYFTRRYVLSIELLWWAIIEKEGTPGNLKETRREQWLPRLPPKLVPIYKYLKKRCPYRKLYPFASFAPLVWPKPLEEPED
jgi:hypothetical protein